MSLNNITESIIEKQDIDNDNIIHVHHENESVSESGNSVSFVSSVKSKDKSVTLEESFQQFMQDNFGHMNQPENNDMNYRTQKAVQLITMGLKYSEEKAKMIWSDYCKIRNWKYYPIQEHPPMIT